MALNSVLGYMLYKCFGFLSVCNDLITAFLSNGSQEIVIWHHHQTPGLLPRQR